MTNLQNCIHLSRSFSFRSWSKIGLYGFSFSCILCKIILIIPCLFDPIYIFFQWRHCYTSRLSSVLNKLSEQGSSATNLDYWNLIFSLQILCWGRYSVFGYCSTNNIIVITVMFPHIYEPEKCSSVVNFYPLFINLPDKHIFNRCVESLMK